MNNKPYQKYFTEGELKTVQEIENWINSLSIPPRKPNQISKVEHDAIIRLKNILINPEYKQHKDFRDKMILDTYSQLRLPKETYEEIYSDTKNQPEIVKGKFATYKKNDMGSYKRFLDNIKSLEEFFSTLKNYHKIPLNNLIVEFVSTKDMSTPAQYKTSKKVIWVNPLSKKVGNTLEEYGSLRYIILHELGHKFLQQNPQSWNISDPNLYTTSYSKKNSQTMTEEESFAELFALSHWKNKYPQYKEQIQEFEKRLEI